MLSLLWEPATIQVGQNTKFGVVFQDNSQNTVSQVSYSIKITEAGGKVVTDLHDQKATDGTGLIPGVKFDKAGPAIVLVTVDAVAGQPMGDFVESASFKVVVAPDWKNREHFQEVRLPSLLPMLRHNYHLHRCRQYYNTLINSTSRRRRCGCRQYYNTLINSTSRRRRCGCRQPELVEL